MENISDEIEALRAIYCLPGEFEMEEEGEESTKERQITMNLKGKNSDRHDICLKVFLGSLYPLVSPEISVSSCNLRGNIVKQLRSELQEILRDNIGFHVLLDITSYTSDKLDFLTSDSDTKVPTVDKNTVVDSGQSVVLLHLDHMRAQTQYIKTIKKWTTELGLTGRLIFFKKLIFILLLGCSSNLKKYVTLNRTTNVDVDSKGHSCKERMLTVLCEQKITEPSTVFKDFQVVHCETEEEIKKIFSGEQLRGIFREFVENYLNFDRKCQK